MANILELNAKIRETLGKKVKTLRKKGIIPAVLYGTKVKSAPLEIDYNEFEKLFEKAGESTIIKLKVNLPAGKAGLPAGPPSGRTGKAGSQKPKVDEKNVLIHEIVRDPVYDKFIHVDFYQVRMDKLITAEVPLIFEGESPAVEVEDGVLIKNITEVDIEALPLDLPREIKVDISMLKTFDDLIRIKDLKVSEKVKILVEPDEVVVSIIPPRSEEELAALEEKVEEKVEEVGKIGEEEEVPVPAEGEIGEAKAPTFDENQSVKKEEKQK